MIEHDREPGVGGAIVTGYARCRELGIDVTCVMAGDNQMDPDELGALVGPVARGEVDYAKANRLVTGEAWQLIPRSRYLGNAILSLLTKIASGYWHVADSQAGYTALSLDALRRLDLDRLYRRYGFPNDMLVHLNVQNASVRDIPSRPIYGVGERSGIRIRSVAPRIAWLLFKGFWWRMKEKYVIRDFHPLVFFYTLGFLMTLVGFLLGLLVTSSASGGATTSRPRRSCWWRFSSSRGPSSRCSRCGSTRRRTRSFAERSRRVPPVVESELVERRGPYARIAAMVGEIRVLRVGGRACKPRPSPKFRQPLEEGHHGRGALVFPSPWGTGR